MKLVFLIDSGPIFTIDNSQRLVNCISLKYVGEVDAVSKDPPVSEILEMASGHFLGEGNAPLPGSMMLMIDEINQINNRGGRFGKGPLDASLQILPDHWFFGCHFQGDPVMPGCLGLDALWQFLGVFPGWSGLPGRGD